MGEVGSDLIPTREEDRDSAGDGGPLWTSSLVLEFLR